MVPYNCLVTVILQNIFFCVQQKKQIHSGLEKLEGEYMTILIFGFNIPLNKEYQVLNQTNQL